MKHLLLLAVLALVLGGCSAQQKTAQVAVAPTSKPAIPISRVSSPIASKQVLALQPRSELRSLALSQMPRGAKSEFFGACKARFHSGNNRAIQELATHFYAVPTDAGGKRGSFSLFMDVFRADVDANQSPRLNLLNRVDLTQLPSLNGNWAHGSDSINTADLTWIDAKQQTPLLKVKMSGTAISGIAGCYALVAFPNGLEGAATSQSFDTYDQPMGGMDIGFNRDKGGQFVVYEQSIGYNLEIPDPVPEGVQEMKPSLGPRTYFDWNGEEFVARTAKR